MDLQDSFRLLNPDTTDTTHTNTGCQRASRLDRIYVPNGIPVTQCKHLNETLLFTDHKGVVLEIGDREVRGRSPHWKFNDSLLDTVQFREAITHSIQHTLLGGENNIHNRMTSLRDSFRIISQHFGSEQKNNATLN